MGLFDRLFGRKRITTAGSDQRIERIADPTHAVQLLFEKLRSVDDMDAKTEEDKLKRLEANWGGSLLVKGDEAQVREVVLRNLRARTGERGFAYFNVEAFPVGKCVNVDALFPDHFEPIGVWRTGNGFSAFGGQAFQR